MKNPASRHRSREDRDRAIESAQSADTQRSLALIQDAAVAAASVRPAYAKLRQEIIGLVNRGAGPHRIAGLLLKLQTNYPEIDATEIYDLQARCAGCWRYASECDESPCGLDEYGRPARSPAEDVPPPPELAANAEVPF